MGQNNSQPMPSWVCLLDSSNLLAKSGIFNLAVSGSSKHFQVPSVPNYYGNTSFLISEIKNATVSASRVRQISPKFSCIKFFQIRDVPTQIPGHPGHSLSKTTEKGQLHKVFVCDIPTSGSRMSQEYLAQKLRSRGGGTEPKNP